MAIFAKDAFDLICNPPPNPEAWLEPKILPKSATMILGAGPKTGKSYLGLEFARALTTGGHLFHDYTFKVPTPARVLYCEQEIGEISLGQRFTQTFLNHKPSDFNGMLKYITQEPGLLLNDDAKLRELHATLEENKINVCILDPFAHFHGVDENCNTSIGEIFRRLNKLKKTNITRGLSFILIHHTKKAPYDKNGYNDLDPENMRGSSRTFADPDTIIMAKRVSTKWQKHPSGEIDQDTGKVKLCETWTVKLGFHMRHGSAPDSMLLNVFPEQLKPITVAKKGGLI